MKLPRETGWWVSVMPYRKTRDKRQIAPRSRASPAKQVRKLAAGRSGAQLPRPTVAAAAAAAAVSAAAAAAAANVASISCGQAGDRSARGTRRAGNSANDAVSGRR